MANQEHLTILRQSADAWNQWRTENLEIKPDLSGVILSGAILEGANLFGANLCQASLDGVNLCGANLEGANLCGANLEGANLSGANLKGANLGWVNLGHADLSGATLRSADLTRADFYRANLERADLSRTNLERAILYGANFERADLSGAKLWGADLSDADLSGATLEGTDLAGASLLSTNFAKANLTNCIIYGISAWDLNLTDTIQKDLIVTHTDQPAVTVDNLEVAQFIYLLLHNEKIRQVIDTITSKAVLILGRFTPERKAILNRLRDALRQRDYVPILFDFDKPTNEDFTGTIKTLAGMCHFVIADITNPKSSPLELQATVPDYMIPFVPIIQEDEEPFAMFVDLWIRHRDWVLEPLKYVAAEDLIAVLEEAIIQPAEQRYAELTLRKAQALMTRHTSQYRSNA